jgi:hypothetical protein
MPRDPLPWPPLLQHWTRCLGEGSEAIARLGDLGGCAVQPGGEGQCQHSVGAVVT